MALPFGTFRIYQRTSDGANVHYRQVARIVYAETGTQVLEDSTGVFSKSLPDGPLDGNKQRFLNLIPTWSYYLVVPEQPGTQYPAQHSHPL